MNIKATPIQEFPTNPEAEEAVLGCLLFDSSAIDYVHDILPVEAFSYNPHRVIYKVCLLLWSSGEKTDLVSVSQYLADNDLLETAGGMSALSKLVNSTVSAENVDRYSQIILEKYQRRRLIELGNNLVALGQDTSQPIEEAVSYALEELRDCFMPSPKSEIGQTEVSVNYRIPDIEGNQIIEMKLTTLAQDESRIKPIGKRLYQIAVELEEDLES